jgi:serine/threonine protein kinase
MNQSAPLSALVHDNDFVVEEDFHDKYLLGKKLGKGAFAQVYLVSEVSDDGVVGNCSEKAVKILDVRCTGDEQRAHKLQKSAYYEANVWASVGQHSHVVQIFDAFYDTNASYMVMERCACDLYKYLESASDINERFIGELISQMLLGVSHVHASRVIHRDIKPDNFMMGGDDGKTVKLGDFGLSKPIPPNGVLIGVYGTAPFMCPEMIRGWPYDERADVWSMGVLAYALLFGNFPYTPKVPCSKGMKQAIVDGKPPKYQPLGYFSDEMRSESAVEFVRNLLDRDIDTRPSAEDALEMKYMVDCRQNEHLSERRLPSLRPMIRAAKKAGAFDVRNLAEESEIDSLLQKMQMEKHGGPLVPEVRILRTSDPNETESSSLAPSIGSNAWCKESCVKAPTSNNSLGVTSRSHASKPIRKESSLSTASTRSNSLSNGSSAKSSASNSASSMMSSPRKQQTEKHSGSFLLPDVRLSPPPSSSEKKRNRATSHVLDNACNVRADSSEKKPLRHSSSINSNSWRSNGWSNASSLSTAATSSSNVPSILSFFESFAFSHMVDPFSRA